MHILLLHQAFASIHEAGGTRHDEMARFLVEQGHRVTIIASPVSYLTGRKSDAPAPAAQEMDPEGLTVLRTYTYSTLHISFAHRIFAFLTFMVSSFTTGLKIKHVDLVWGPSPPIFQTMSAWLLARIKRVPFLLEIRDLWPDFAVAVGVLRNPLLIRISYWLESFLYRHADEIIVNSPGFIANITSKGARQVSLVPNGADPRMFEPDDSGEIFRREHQLEDKIVFLYAGAHGMSNDLDVILEASQRLKRRPEIAFVLVGDGKEKPRLMQKAVDMDLTNLVFLPPYPKLEMTKVLAAADACIAILKPIPMYATVYPNKVFDYMAAGKPVLLAIDGVIRDVVEEVNAGIPVTPGNAVELAEAACSLADQPDLRHQMGRNGRAYIERSFDRVVLARQLEAIMQNLVDSKK